MQVQYGSSTAYGLTADSGLGYWRNADDTAHTFGATHPDAEGTYLRTGDLADPL